MFKFNEDEENLKCSFCGKDQDQVKEISSRKWRLYMQ